MAAPRRSLMSSLLRAASPTVIRTAARPFSTALAPAQTSRAWRPLGATSPKIAPLRWYSIDPELPGCKKYSAEQITEQIAINDELEGTDKWETSDGRKRAIFVDVREPEEIISAGRIPGAINIPITSAVQSFHISADDFVDLYGFEKPEPSTPLIMYCKAGIRARSAAGLAQHAGYENVAEYPGSWLDWMDKQGEVEKRHGNGAEISWIREKTQAEAKVEGKQELDEDVLRQGRKGG